MKRVRSHFLCGPSKSLSIDVWSVLEEEISSDSRVVDDLPRLSVSCHSRLWCLCICAHLQANYAFSFGQLFLCELPLVLLSFPVENKQTSKETNICHYYFSWQDKKKLLSIAWVKRLLKFFCLIGWHSQRETSNSLQIAQKSHVRKMQFSNWSSSG